MTQQLSLSDQTYYTNIAQSHYKWYNIVASWYKMQKPDCISVRRGAIFSRKCNAMQQIFHLTLQKEKALLKLH